MAKERRGLTFRRARLASVFSAAFLLAACGGAAEGPRAAGVTAVLSGVLSWARRDWPSSVSHFLDSLEQAESSGNEVVGYYALYGLGSTYLSGDERRAAESRFDAIGPDAPPEIVASTWYQRGVIAYRDGDYERAALSFRHAIEIGGVSTDARVNLELSLRSRDESRSRASSGPSAAQTEPSDDPAADSVFNLIRKKEQDRWKNQETEQTGSGSPDY